MSSESAAPQLDESQSDLGESEGVSQIVSFRLASEEYGVDIMHVQEIILIGQITQMPQVPEYVRGLINLRGHVIPILDLRIRFSLPVEDLTDDSRIIVVNVAGKTVGIIVDAVDEVLRINSEQLDNPPSGLSGVGEEYVSGLIRFESKLLILLNIEAIVVQEAAACSPPGSGVTV